MAKFDIVNWTMQWWVNVEKFWFL